MKRILALAALLGLLLPSARADFLRAERPREWRFPRDHASHAGYQTEWWYFTGRVRTKEGVRFGYELTFFRVGLREGSTPDSTASESEWRARDLIVAHLTVTDLREKEFHHHEKIQRAAAGLAGVSEERLDVWIGDWSAQQVEDRFVLRADAPEFGLRLTLEPQSDPVLHGEAGLSMKRSDGSQASHYYSLPRSSTRGQLRIGKRELDVRGNSWMDHEFFTGSTPAEGLGWDWFSANLDDGRDLMLYRVRHPDGDEYAFGTLMEGDSSRRLDMTGATWTPGSRWTSPTSGARYPVEWNIELPAESISLEVRALLDQQEVQAPRSVGFSYWEGYCDYRVRMGEAEIGGEGYAELTGYLP